MWRTVAVCAVSAALIFLPGTVRGKDYNACLVTFGGKVYKEVKIDGGWVRGREADDGNYLAFLGIPYAAPPLGANRFKAPQPLTPWKGVLTADRIVKCPQFGMGDEDCLVVNVYTPKKIINGPLPVLVHIHGGAFLMGKGQSSGLEPLVSKNIIVVTFNYRLGVLGFLCLGIDEAPGNAGLKDQVAALKWVRDNIEYFGGDPNQVTLYGASVGGASVEFNIFSPLSKGLFQRAFVECGTTNTAWSTAPDPVSTAFKLAAYLNYPSKKRDVCELAEFLQTVPADALSIVNARNILDFTGGNIGFVPCLERNLEGIEPFIQESPRTILTEEKYHKVPVLYSFASLSGLLLTGSAQAELSFKDEIESNSTHFVPPDLYFCTSEAKFEISEQIKNFYFDNKPIEVIDLLKFIGDAYILHGLLNTVQVQSRNNPVYLMEFAYKGKLNNYDMLYENITQSGHTDMLNHLILSKPITSERDKHYVELLSTLVTNFVKFGDPNPLWSQSLPFSWPQTEPQNLTYVSVGERLQLLQRPRWERKLFWDQLYSMYGRNVQPSYDCVTKCH